MDAESAYLELELCGVLSRELVLFCTRYTGHRGPHGAEVDAGGRDRRGRVILERVEWGPPDPDWETIEAVSRATTAELFERLAKLEPVEDEGGALTPPTELEAE